MYTSSPTLEYNSYASVGTNLSLSISTKYTSLIKGWWNSSLGYFKSIDALLVIGSPLKSYVVTNNGNFSISTIDVYDTNLTGIYRNT